MNGYARRRSPALCDRQADGEAATALARAMQSGSRAAQRGLSKEYVVRIHYLACLVPALFLGCTSATSTDVKTSGISADYGVTTFEGTTQASVRATFTIGSTYLDLQGGDAAYCDGVALNREKNVLGQIEYTGSLPRKAVGQTYTFELRRSGETLRSTVNQPASFTVAAPTQGQDLKVGTSATVRWSGTGNQTRVTIGQNDCLDTAWVDAPATATEATLPGDKIRFSQGKTGPCNAATVSVSRNVEGVGSSSFKSVSIKATNIAEVPVHVVP